MILHVPDFTESRVCFGGIVALRFPRGVPDGGGGGGGLGLSSAHLGQGRIRVGGRGYLSVFFVGTSKYTRLHADMAHNLSY